MTHYSGPRLGVCVTAARIFCEIGFVPSLEP